MRITFFSTHKFDREAFDQSNASRGHELVYLDARLTAATASLAKGSTAVCAFVSDLVDGAALEKLHEGGARVLLLRAAGFNNVDLPTAERLGMVVLRVPAYSPEAVAEHAIALLLAVIRRLPRAFSRVRDGNFSLDGLVGTNLHGRTFGIVGTGRIGAACARIAMGFGGRVLAHDVREDAGCLKLGIQYVPLEELIATSDVLSLHLPLMPATHHLLGREAFSRMKKGAVLVNTSRGGLVDTDALIDALKSGHLGGAGLDVYEGEDEYFFRDLSGQVIEDDRLARLLTFPNVAVTAHQAFLTREALGNIADTTLENATAFEQGGALANRVETATKGPPRP